MNQDWRGPGSRRIDGRGFDWRGFGVVVAAAVLVRGAMVAAAILEVGPFDQLDQDPDSYRQIAETLAETGTFGITAADGSVDPTAFRPPLYPWLLSWLAPGGELSLIAVGMLHWVIGVLTCVGVWDVLRRLSAASPGSAIAAGLLTAIDPLLLMQSTLVMTETLAAGIAVAAWWAAAHHGSPQRGRPQANSSPPGGGWRWGLIVGGFLAAGHLCRPVFIVWAALWIVYLAVLAGRSQSRRRWAVTQVAAIALMLVVSVGAWMLRNQRAIGAPVWATTHGGYTLLLGNNPYFYDYLESRSFAEAALWGAAWEAEAFHEDWAQRLRALAAAGPGAGERAAGAPARQDGELAADRLAGELAKDEIRQRPGMFLYASLVRVGRLWSPVPRVGDQVGPVSWAIGVFYSALGIGAGLGVWRLRRHWGNPRWAPALLLLVAVTLVHAVYWSNLRMRAPVMPFVAAIAAVGICGVRAAGTERPVPPGN